MRIRAKIRCLSQGPWPWARVRNLRFELDRLAGLARSPRRTRTGKFGFCSSSSRTWNRKLPQISNSGSAPSATRTCSATSQFASDPTPMLRIRIVRWWNFFQILTHQNCFESCWKDAHRVILAAQSSTFRDMLIDRPLNKKGKIDIDMEVSSPEAAKEFPNLLR